MNNFKSGLPVGDVTIISGPISAAKSKIEEITKTVALEKANNMWKDKSVILSGPERFALLVGLTQALNDLGIEYYVTLVDKDKFVLKGGKNE